MNPTPMTGKVAKQAKSAPEKSSASKPRAERASGRAVSHGADTQVPGWVAFVGTGPGDENLLTVRAAALIGRADLVVAPQWVGERLGRSPLRLISLTRLNPASGRGKQFGSR